MKRHAPAALRNRDAIADVLATVMPESGRVLEVASGSGEHAVWFGRRFPHIELQPSDLDPVARASVDAHIAEADVANVRPSIEIDACAASWPVEELDGLICVNMIHIAPWEACLGLLDGAARVVRGGGFLFLYGPYYRDEVETAPSNIRFDQSLRSRDPRWGVRRLEDVTAEASARGFTREALVEMPANNLSLIFRRAG